MSEIHPHYVRPTSTASIPQNLVFVDVESRSRVCPATGDEVQSFRLGVAISVQRMQGQWQRREVIHFTSTFDFWDFLTSKLSPKKPVWVFSHNLSVDAAWLDTWKQLDEQNLKLHIPCPNCGEFRKGPCKDHHPFRGACVASDPPVILCFKSRAGIIRMVDTLNYWRTSVYKLGRGVGHPKIMVKGDAPDDEVLFQICEADATVIEKAVCGLLDMWDREQCGHFAATAAGLAWNAYRHIVEEKQVLIKHTEPQIGLQRAAYYGGQAEAFYVGPVKEPVWLYDVRSLYPSVMAGRYYPVEFREMGTDLRPAKVLQRLEFDCCVANVVIRTGGAGYPFRIVGGMKRAPRGENGEFDPRTHHVPDRLGFPTGRYVTALAGPELARAIERGDCEEVLSVAWFRRAKLFDRFVAEWFAKRPADVTAETFCQDLLCKTVLNSLSGYWAKHKIRWTDRPDLRPLVRWGEWWGVQAQTGKVSKYRAIGGSVQELDEPGEARDSFPAISAHITSYGREQMLWVREQLPEKSCYYQDTDSLILNAAGVGRLNALGLIGGGELGRLRLVRALPDLVIHAVKDYEYRGHRVVAGVREKATVIGPGRWLQEKWESIADQWSRGGSNEVRVREELFALSRTRIPRPVGPDGWTSAPTIDTKTEVPF